MPENDDTRTLETELSFTVDLPFLPPADSNAYERPEQTQIPGILDNLSPNNTRIILGDVVISVTQRDETVPDQTLVIVCDDMVLDYDYDYRTMRRRITLAGMESSSRVILAPSKSDDSKPDSRPTESKIPRMRKLKL